MLTSELCLGEETEDRIREFLAELDLHKILDRMSLSKDGGSEMADCTGIALQSIGSGRE